MALVIVAGASGQHAAVVYEAAIFSGMPIVGFTTIGDAAPPPTFDCKWLGFIRDVGLREIDRGSTFIVVCGSNTLRRGESEILDKQGASLQASVIRRQSSLRAPI